MSQLRDPSARHTEQSLRDAVALVHRWMIAAGRTAGDCEGRHEDFWPQEEALRGWLAIALVQTGYCDAFETIAEPTFGEEEGSDGKLLKEAEALAHGISKYNVRFDLAVASGPPRGACRSFASFSPAPTLLVEVKSLNSASGVKRRDIRSDLMKLDGGARWWASRGSRVETLMVVFATAHKDDKAGASKRPDEVKGWIVDEFSGAGPKRAVDVPTGILIAGVFPDGVVWCRT